MRGPGLSAASTRAPTGRPAVWLAGRLASSMLVVVLLLPPRRGREQADQTPTSKSRQGSKQENPSKQPYADLVRGGDPQGPPCLYRPSIHVVASHPASPRRTVAKRHAGGARSACHGPSMRLELQETQAYFVHTCIRGRPQMVFAADARMHALTQTERQPGLRATAATSSVGTASVPSA